MDLVMILETERKVRNSSIPRPVQRTRRHPEFGEGEEKNRKRKRRIRFKDLGRESELSLVNDPHG